MNASPEVKDLANALCKAQATMEAAKKDSENPHFKSKYADLASVVAAIKRPFADNGLSYVQLPMLTQNEEVVVETVLLHTSGQWISSQFAIPVSKADAHGHMSALTYCRRGALAAIAGIASDDDDDGNTAAAAPPMRGDERMSHAFRDAYASGDASPRLCPVCRQDAIRGGNGRAYYCWKKIGGCGMTWPDGPFPTAPPADLAKPGIVSEAQADREAVELFATPEEEAERKERNVLIGKIKAQADIKRVPAKERNAMMAAHCGQATLETADIAALAGLLEALEAK